MHRIKFFDSRGKHVGQVLVSSRGARLISGFRGPSTAACESKAGERSARSTDAWSCILTAGTEYFRNGRGELHVVSRGLGRALAGSEGAGNEKKLQWGPETQTFKYGPGRLLGIGEPG